MRILLLVFLFLSITLVLISQSPQGFKYQTVVRDGAGQVIQNQNVSLRISILSGTMSGPVEYQEEHSLTTNNFGLVNLEIGSGNVVSGDFTNINWGNSAYFVQVELDETGGTNYQLMGVSQLLSVPYAMYANNAGMVDSTIWKRNANNIFYNDGNVGIGEITPTGKLVVKSDTTALIDDVIFSVLNADGDTVMAVYQEGVRIWVSDDTTSGTKAVGNRGGFAVGGFTPAKGFTNEYLRVTPDSVRVYIEEDGGGTKAVGNRGGFAVGGFSPAKTMTDYYFNIEHISGAETINPSEPRILWYPEKEAVLAGRVLIEHADSVGLNSVAIGYENKPMGAWSQALGYKTKTLGDYSSAIGRHTYAKGEYSFAFGDSSYAEAMRSFSLGYKSEAKGIGSFAMGTEGVSQAGLPLGLYTSAGGDYSFAVGMGAVTTSSALAGIAIGLNSTSNGYAASAIGVNNYSEGIYSSSIGSNNYSNGTYALTLGSNDTVVAANSMAIGFGASVYGVSSMAIGTNVEASGISSAAIGFNSQATGNYSSALGHFVSTNGHSGSWVIGDFSTPVTTNATLDNQFMVRASGGYVFYSNTTLTEANTVYISPLTGNLGVGVAIPQRKVHINDVMRLEPRTSAPSGAMPGDMYFDATTQKLRVYTLLPTPGWKDCN